MTDKFTSKFTGLILNQNSSQFCAAILHTLFLEQNVKIIQQMTQFSTGSDNNFLMILYQECRDLEPPCEMYIIAAAF